MLIEDVTRCGCHEQLLLTRRLQSGFQLRIMTPHRQYRLAALLRREHLMGYSNGALVILIRAAELGNLAIQSRLSRCGILWINDTRDRDSTANSLGGSFFLSLSS